MHSVVATDFRVNKPTDDAAENADILNDLYQDAEAQELVAVMIGREFAGRIALVSSFGAGSAVLLHMVAQVDPSTPILFLDTEKHFGETRTYRDRLVDLLGLSDVRAITPDPELVNKHDPSGVLWMHRPDYCCYIRKVLPFQKALGGFDAWFTGRRRQQSDTRATMGRIEYVEGQTKINPLACWSSEDVDAYFTAHNLPRHPLEEDGFLSIGCMPCTDRVAPGEDTRAGRWRNGDKTECGVHLPKTAFKDYGADI